MCLTHRQREREGRGAGGEVEGVVDICISTSGQSHPTRKCVSAFLFSSCSEVLKSITFTCQVLSYYQPPGQPARTWMDSVALNHCVLFLGRSGFMCCTAFCWSRNKPATAVLHPSQTVVHLTGILNEQVENTVTHRLQRTFRRKASVMLTGVWPILSVWTLLWKLVGLFIIDHSSRKGLLLLGVSFSSVIYCGNKCKLVHI